MEKSVLKHERTRNITRWATSSESYLSALKKGKENQRHDIIVKIKQAVVERVHLLELMKKYARKC
jgi:hypothetical protein